MSQTATTDPLPRQADASLAAALEQAIDATPQDRMQDAVAKRLGVSSKGVCDLLRNVWSVSKGQEPLTKREMFEGMSMIARFELDPISREIYVTRDNKGRLMTLVAVDGWVKILDRTDHYDGHETTVKFKDGQEGNPSAVISATTTIYSTKRSHPTVYEAFVKEYSALSGFMAGKIPLHMLRIFSLRHAARLFTPLGGNVMLEEEADWINREIDQAPPTIGQGPSHEEQADALAAERESQPPTAPVSDPTPPEEDSEEDREAAVARNQLLEESGIGAMLAAAETLGKVDLVATTIQADIRLDKVQKATLMEACESRKKVIRGGRGSRSKKE